MNVVYLIRKLNVMANFKIDIVEYKKITKV